MKDFEVIQQIFESLNEKHFDGFLTAPEFRWNSRLRSSAGRFIPGSRDWESLLLGSRPPVIEFATYLLEEPNFVDLISDTLAHELIHYWLWIRKRPYGHTDEFMQKLKIVGASRYNPVPRTRPYKYAYRCISCAKEFYARRKLRPLACLKCCRQFAEGKYDPRFQLVFDRELSACEALEIRK